MACSSTASFFLVVGVFLSEHELGNVSGMKRKAQLLGHDPGTGTQAPKQWWEGVGVPSAKFGKPRLTCFLVPDHELPCRARQSICFFGKTGAPERCRQVGVVWEIHRHSGFLFHLFRPAHKDST